MSPADADSYRFDARGRSWRVLAAVLVVWGLIGMAWVRLEAAWWVLAPFALATLPALWDLIRDPRSGVRLTAQRLEWWTRRHHDGVGLREVEQVRMTTRLDLSVRVTVRLRDGRSLRLPDAALPPHRAFETELHRRGVQVVRQHFRVFAD